MSNYEFEHGSYDEAEVLRRARSGDEPAFTELFHRYHRIILAFMSRRAEGHIAEDLTQLTFLKAFQSIGNFQDTGSSFDAWLMTIARRTAMDYFRKDYRRREREEIIPDTHMEEEEAPDNPEQSIMAKIAIENVLGTISPDERDMLHHIATGQMTAEQYAEFRGITYAAVRVRLHRLRARLRDELGKPEDMI